uniref:Rho GTPase-activating protein 35 n=1 Tax=Phallusia mammillata TaxID=59560 RepID=A0A6F9D659_9ASCI|nr:rho GTPase-activating protein 35 [Phallusia mammillata]
MSKEKRKSVFNIAVVGLSGTEQYKGSCGVGKSCLCNRFVREQADNYYLDHTSVLSQSDFGGRVVNNDHFLYWGEVNKQDDSGLDYKFNVIEQTEFIDDQTYEAHRTSSNLLYHKRCAQTKVSSAEKMMYICTDQLGIESDFEIKPMPDGKLAIDGFLLCIDVSLVANRTIDDQIRFVQTCHHYVAKTKKPVVLALTKCDEAVTAFITVAEKFACSPQGKKSSALPVIETSASENINVTLAFVYLAQLIDKSRSKSKIISFDDAAQVRKNILKAAKEQLEKLLEDKVEDYHESWQTARQKLENETQYRQFVELEGKNAASKIFRKHVNHLKNNYCLELQGKYLSYLPRALKIILPDAPAIRNTWNDTVSAMSRSPKFESWIIPSEELHIYGTGLPWYETEHMSSLEDRRIPFELLQTAEAERMFDIHRKELEAKQHRLELKKQFRDLLVESPQVTPGREWGDVVKFFKQYEFLSEITETELSSIYEQFQAEIMEKAKEDFQELLFEKSEIFVSTVNTTRVGINDALKEDPRYINMAKLQKEREEILTRHITEALYPPTDNWGPRCLGKALNAQRALKPCKNTEDQLFPPALRWQLKPDSKTLNIVLLGADGLSQDLANEITVGPLSNEEYKLDGCVHDLSLRPICGDVTLPSNTFQTLSFSPHGCIAVYSTIKSLRYIEESLEKMVVPSLESNHTPPFQGLPISILLACYADSDKQTHQLRDAGERLASRIGCPFIDVLEPEYAYNRRFHDSQIIMAMRSLIEGIKERAGSGRNSFADLEQAGGGLGIDPGMESPDLRIIMCTRQDDLPTAEVALAPLLNHSSFHDAGQEIIEGEETEDAIVVVTYLGTKRRRIAITLTSYQSARNLMSQGNPIHGFILVYDTQRKSSLSVMKVFATNTASAYPSLILCVSPNEEQPAAAAFFRQDTEARQLVVAGNALADELQAKFVSASSRHKRQTEVYSTFFKDAWEHKENTEAIHRISRIIVEEDQELKEMDEESILPIPAPRSRSRVSETKSSSVENIPVKSMYEAPRTENIVTPPSTLRFNISSQSSYTESQGISDPGHATPASTWSTGSDEYKPETPRTSPTAGLLDNEQMPDYEFDSALRTTPKPGKLRPELLHAVEVGIKKKPVKHAGLMHQSSLQDLQSSSKHSDKFPKQNLEYFDMPRPDPTHLGLKVLPVGPEAFQTKSNTVTTPTANGVKIALQPGSSGQKQLPRSSAITSSGLGRKFTKNGKRQPLKSVDIDSTPTFAQTPPPTLRPSRHSTADLLAIVPNENIGAMKRGLASSHEDLLHLSPSVPSSMPSYHGNTPKEEKRHKQKEEEKRKKEGKEKEQKMRMKMKGKNRPPPTSQATGNKHTLSDYFNKRLDDTIQGLNHMIPLFVEKCIRFIENYGLCTEGLYRIPANSKEREMLIKKFDEDNNYEFVPSEVSVSTVAGCVTWFFGHKNLPDPLIPYQLHDELEEAIKMPDRSLQLCSVRGVVRKLPYSNYATFKFLCAHLKHVGENETKNKMSIENLAICWWPTLFRPEVDSANAMAGITKTCHRDVLHTCIEQHAFIFCGQQEV